MRTKTIMAGQMMDAGFDSFDVLQIAGRVQDNAIRFYTEQSELSVNPGVRNVCYELAGFWAMRRRVLSRRLRHQAGITFAASEVFEDAPFEPQAMAGLSVFASKTGSGKRPAHFETAVDVFSDAIRRCEEVGVFYRGLKDFVCDLASDSILDELIDVDRQYIESLSATLREECLARRQDSPRWNSLNS